MFGWAFHLPKLWGFLTKAHASPTPVHWLPQKGEGLSWADAKTDPGTQQKWSDDPLTSQLKARAGRDVLNLGFYRRISEE